MRSVFWLLGAVLLLSACGKPPRPRVVAVQPEFGRPEVVRAGAIKAALELAVDFEMKPGGPARVVYDNESGGAMAARWAAEMQLGEGEVAVVGVDLERADARARIGGFLGVLKAEFPMMRVVRTASVGPSKEAATRFVDGLIESHPQLRILFADGEPAAEGALEALRARANSQVRTIVAASGEPVIAALQHREIDGLLVEDSFRAGYEAVVAAVGGKRGERIPIPVQLVKRHDLEKPEVIELLHPDLMKWNEALNSRRE